MLAAHEDRSYTCAGIPVCLALCAGGWGKAQAPQDGVWLPVQDSYPASGADIRGGGVCAPCWGPGDSPGEQLRPSCVIGAVCAVCVRVLCACAGCSVCVCVTEAVFEGSRSVVFLVPGFRRFAFCPGISSLLQVRLSLHPNIPVCHALSLKGFSVRSRCSTETPRCAGLLNEGMEWAAGAWASMHLVSDWSLSPAATYVWEVGI